MKFELNIKAHTRQIFKLKISKLNEVVKDLLQERKIMQ